MHPPRLRPATSILTHPVRRFKSRSRIQCLRFYAVHPPTPPSAADDVNIPPLPPSKTHHPETHLESHPPQTTSHSISPHEPPPPPLPKAKPRPRSLRPYIKVTSYVLLGLVLGNGFRLLIIPPPLPEPGSVPDRVLLERLEKDIDRLEIVKELRAGRLGTPSQLGDGVMAVEGVSEGGWIELPSTHPHDHDNALPPVTDMNAATPAERLGSLRAQRRSFTERSMSGFRGYGISRTFWNPEQKSLIRVLWFGSGLTGWPGVVHGGSTATALSDSMGTLMQLQSQETPNLHQTDVIDPDSLSLTYVKRASPHDFYIVHVGLRDDVHQEGAQGIGPWTEVETKAEKATAHIGADKDKTKHTQPLDGGMKALFGLGGPMGAVGTVERADGTVCVKGIGGWENRTLS